MALTKPAGEFLLTFANGAVAQNTMIKSSEIDLDGSSPFDATKNVYYATLFIKAFLNTTTAHLGTRFIVQIYDGKDWVAITGLDWIDLIGTANSEPITNNPLAAGSSSITCASTTGYLNGAMFGIADATVGNSEICLQKALTTNTNLSTNDVTQFAHVQNTLMYNIAMKRALVDVIPISAKKVRVTIDNTYSPSGSTLVCEISMTKVTKL